MATGATATATFNFNISANRTVNLDLPVTIGTVLFGDTGGNELWTLTTTNGSVLTMDNGASKPKIRAVQPGTGFSCNVVIAGTNGFRGPDTGSGVLSLGAANTFTGDLEIDRSTLKINNANAIPSGPGYGNVILVGNIGNGGAECPKLDLGSFSPTINGLSSVFDPVAYPAYTTPPFVFSSAGSGTSILTVGAGDASAEFGGIISNGVSRTVGLTKTGTGTQTLTNANTYSGATTINAGTLKFAVAGACASSDVTVGANGTLYVQYPGSDARWRGKSLTFSASGATLKVDFGANQPSTTVAPVSLTAGVTLTATPTIVIAGPTIADGAYPFIKYTTILSGSLPSTVSLPGGGTGTLVDNSGSQTVFLYVGAIAPNIHWATGNGAWDFSTANWKGTLGSTLYTDGVPVEFKDADVIGNPTITLNTTVSPASVAVNSGTNFTLTGSGAISGAANLTKSGTGALTLNLDNSYSGGTTLSGGKLNLQKSMALGDTSGALTINAGTLDNTSGSPLALAGYYQNWFGDFTYAGSNELDVSAGTVYVTSLATRTVTVNASTLSLGDVRASGSTVIKAGAGTLQIKQPTIMTGTVRVQTGTLLLADPQAVKDADVNLLNTDSGVLSFGALTNATFGALSGSRNLGLTNASGAPVQLQVGLKNTTATYSGFLSGSGSLTKINAGSKTSIFQLGNGGAGGGTYTGDTTISAGILRPGASNVLPHGVGKGNVIIEAAGTFDFLDRTLQTFNGLFGSGLVNSSDIGGLTTTNQTLNLGDGNANGEFSGIIQEVAAGGKTAGSISVIKIGSGTQVFSGPNAYSGTTTVNGGVLQIDSPGSLPATAVTVNTGGALTGVSGSIYGPVTVNSGGSISAGTNGSAGLLMLNAGLDLSSGGTDVWDLAALEDDSNGTGGSNFDVINLTGGALTLGGSSKLRLAFSGTATAPDKSVPFWQISHRWTIIGTGSAASNFASIENGFYGAGTFTTAVEGGGIVLIFTPGDNVLGVTSFNITPGPGSSMTLNYAGGAGSRFVLMGTNNVAAPLANWTRVKTNATTPGSFVITPGSDPRAFYRVKSE